MPKLADLNISRCQDCGRLFKSDVAAVLCSRCENSLEAVRGGIAGDPAPAMDPAAGPAVDAGAICLHCERAEVIEGSDYCLLCNVALFRALGDAAQALVSQLAMPAQRPGLETAMVFRGLMEKRQRETEKYFKLAAGRRSV